ncbi:MAG TPA: hypothetical protein VFY17_04440 [Pilimelia sp.]|nr:hypothetical protein [Pilimelia sp.]
MNAALLVLTLLATLLQPAHPPAPAPSRAPAAVAPVEHCRDAHTGGHLQPTGAATAPAHLADSGDEGVAARPLRRLPLLPAPSPGIRGRHLPPQRIDAARPRGPPTERAGR